MNSKILLLSLLLLLVSPLTTQATDEKPCYKRNPETSDYQLRESNGNRRCEGIKRQPIGKSLELTSLTVGRLQSTNQLALRIPNVSKNKPNVVVRYPAKNYQLDHVDLSHSSGWFQMQWSNSVLRRENIEPERLFATAEIPPSGSSTTGIRVPVILNALDRKYEFVFQCDECETKVNNFEVSYGNKKMECTQNIGDSRTARFLCNGNKVPAGKYKILLSYEIKPTDSSSYESVTPIVTYLKHNPEWLK